MIDGNFGKNLLSLARLKREKESSDGNVMQDSVNQSIHHDEDDQRQADHTCKDPKANKIPGSNLTRYSMWGKYCPDYKGSGDGFPAMLAMNASLGGFKAPLRRSMESVKQRQEVISRWWGTEKYTGPKRKKRKESKKMVVKWAKGPICEIVTEDYGEGEQYVQQAYGTYNKPRHESSFWELHGIRLAST